MKIQVGDRITYIPISDYSECIKIINNSTEAKAFQDMIKCYEITVTNIERPNYEKVMEE